MLPPGFITPLRHIERCLADIEFALPPLPLSLFRHDIQIFAVLPATADATPASHTPLLTHYAILPPPLPAFRHYARLIIFTPAYAT
jgi:hypothetical protein